MAQGKQQVIAVIEAVVLSIFIFGCANQMSPPGGEIDKILPYIVESYPANGATNFSEKEVEFSFSEYVNKSKINDAFFISPLIEGYPDFSWTNTTVYVEFPEDLKKNTTYSIIIGTEITDVNNSNNMKEPYILTFSTGSIIDSGKISGKVFAEKVSGTLIFAYSLDTGKVDIYNNKPDYLSQVDDKGKYEISGLANGSYLLFAVKDDFKDLVYNIGDDLIGLPADTIHLTKQKKVIPDINFKIHMEDTLAPNIQSVTMTDRNHLVVEFNEAIDSSNLSVSNFTIVDSTEELTHPIKFWFKQNSKKIEYILCFDDSLNIENEYYLSAKNIEDKYQNRLLSESANFIASEKADTNIIKLTSLETPYDKSKIDYLKPSFNLYFSDAFRLNLDDELITMVSEDSVNLPLKIDKIDDAKLKISVEKDLKESSQFSVLINMKYLSDAAGNIFDTLITKKISTIGDLEFTGASGIINTNYKNVKVVLKNIKDSNKEYRVNMGGNNSFNFKRILPGEFLLWCYEDSDSNSTYSFGQVEPLIFSEDFKFYPDTLKLRARWPVGDISIDF